MNIGGGADHNFIYGMLIFSVSLMFLLPLAINIFIPSDENGIYEDTINDLNDGYASFTGSKPVKETVWGLTGIYTPYSGGAYGYTPDGWLYGTEIHNYTPSQYSSGSQAYTVTNRPIIDGTATPREVYEYSSVGGGYLGISAKDTYTSINMDAGQKSNIFFTSANKTILGGHYAYEFSGYRYAFHPIGGAKIATSDGAVIDTDGSTTSLSLIWYEYYNITSGIAGQLVINYGFDGKDNGLAYITAPEIIKAFDSTTSTARFELNFNGVPINAYIRIDPYYLSGGMSVEECYNNGYWSIMITSHTIDATGYNSAAYSFNAGTLFDTIIDLLTFNLDEYGFSPVISAVCSAIVVIPLYVALITIGLSCWPVLLFTAILGVMNAILAWL